MCIVFTRKTYLRSGSRVFISRTTQFPESSTLLRCRRKRLKRFGPRLHRDALSRRQSIQSRSGFNCYYSVTIKPRRDTVTTPLPPCPLCGKKAALIARDVVVQRRVENNKSHRRDPESENVNTFFAQTHYTDVEQIRELSTRQKLETDLVETKHGTDDGAVTMLYANSMRCSLGVS